MGGKQVSARTFLTLNSDRTEVPDASLSALQDRMRGEVIGPDGAGYDACRTLWNTMIDRRPTCIARCLGAADVIAAVGFAREFDLLCSVRGGGHNVAGKAVADDTLMIDLSPMQDIRVDPSRERARVGAGCLWSAVDAETQAFGLATTGGTVSHTGVAGLTLGGGIGWLGSMYGLTCDNLVSVDLVTASGEYLRVDADEYPDLFSDSLIDVLIEQNEKRPTPESPQLLFRMHGQMNEIPVSATAFPQRRDGWDYDVIAQWTEPQKAEPCIAWARETWDAVSPHTDGVYINHLDHDDDARIRSAYGPNYGRLVDVKRKYDADNFFRLNNNIPPD
ncbi:MAG: hypothetical protein BMS9Abin01_0060 [Gammaproteobacteria bacterium]|nr:MAG: hypothetical protein BMS9Abin01_0060 [Gammaproteobacteria bacterium]